MKSINLQQRLMESKPFTKVEIYFRVDKQVEVHECYSVSEAVSRFNKCLTRIKVQIGDVPFSAELSCRSLKYGDTWKHIKQVAFNQKIA